MKRKGEDRETENMEPWGQAFSASEYILYTLDWDPYPTESQLSWLSDGRMQPASLDRHRS